ncbi:hypothetical protein CN884_22360 [Ochrobactrum sp. 30A/1000/2015]|uniref:Uncharacterized protein n=1 Tax=Agrobacterium pusense TaxID=648995 RepID=A0A6H0ZU92_9HYPH|nr:MULTISPECIES: hypothetical protein [Hyphomicrobiales]PJT18954.1 hypothetical protein CN884_22360 [Ochrobactrum sp. 30A/1000/2015]PJT38904.1 hypothetical protein CN883_10335 [Ochrobactrum sp. 27A/999/2015]PJT41106.1 hypothetical protein CN882_22075 [Ochrobactrum sp. 23A/997/2015]KAB2741400.1 hypothetical protein F9K89_00715 [Brucella anthropi]KAB2788926.1 hypothetical protein F9K96_16455 [Brucella anthropi]
MTHASQSTFAPIGQALADRVLPRFRRAQKLPLRISCLGTISYAGAADADYRDRSVSLGEAASPEDAIALAALRVSRGDLGPGGDTGLRFELRLIVIQDSALGLVLAGEIRAGVILWQHPVAGDGEVRRIVIEASRLRGIAFVATGGGDHAKARDLRFRAALLEARLVDPLWRETAAELLRLPQAA